MAKGYRAWIWALMPSSIGRLEIARLVCSSLDGNDGNHEHCFSFLCLFFVELASMGSHAHGNHGVLVSAGFGHGQKRPGFWDYK
jgi:hypothetical protein